MSALDQIRGQIQQACAKSGRSPESVKIIAVSKLQSTEKIAALHTIGQKDFGENYVQELVEKVHRFSSSDIRWHLIGHLQKNKIKNILGVCSLIHSVDSLALAQKINQIAAEKSLQVNILFQVNVAGETSKEGLDPQILEQEWEQLSSLSNIKILGLMTMPPFTENAEDNRIYFRTLRKLCDRLIEKSAIVPYPGFMQELSMGTTQDYVVAIEEGATMIRVGTLLFGKRETK